MSIHIEAPKELIQFGEQNGYSFMYNKDEGKLYVVDDENNNTWSYANDGTLETKHFISSTARVQTAPTHENDVVRQQDLSEIDGSNVSTSDFENHDHDGSHGENTELRPTDVRVSNRFKLPEYTSKSDSTQDSGLIYVEDEERLIYRRSDS